MRIAALQFDPRLGEHEANIGHADDLLRDANLVEIHPSGQDRNLGRDSNHQPTESPSRLSKIDSSRRKIDLLVLPELAFSGYNFPSSTAIAPYLEPTACGPSAKWAARTSRRLGCIVTVGYPETTSKPGHVPTHVDDEHTQASGSLPPSLPNSLTSRNSNTSPVRHTNSMSPSMDSTSEHSHTRPLKSHNFNSSITVSPTGQVLAHYRKTHLYYTDATWASPSPVGFISTQLPLSFNSSLADPISNIEPSASIPSDTQPSNSHVSNNQMSSIDFHSNEPPTNNHSDPPKSLLQSSPQQISSTHQVSSNLPLIETQSIKTSFVICMDINPQYFTAPWTAYEAATHVLASDAQLLVASMAWLSRAEREALLSAPDEPEIETLGYWIERLSPLLKLGTDKGRKTGAERDGDTSAEDEQDEQDAEHENHEETLAGADAANQQTIVVVANRVGIEPGESRACELDPKLKQLQTERRRGLVHQHVNGEETQNGTSSDTQQSIENESTPNSAKDTEVSPAEKMARQADVQQQPGAEPVETEPECGPLMGMEARYSGTSCVMGLGGGKARVWGILGRAEEGVLVVDTDEEPVVVFRLGRTGSDGGDGHGDEEGDDQGGNGDE